MKAIIFNGKLSIDIITRLLRCYVFSVLLYGVQAWTITEATEKILSISEMWCYRRMWRIAWTEHVTKREVLRRMKKDKELKNTLGKGK